MSDNFLQYVPKVLEWQPAAEAAERAAALAHELFPDADEITAESFDDVQLFAPVGFWDGGCCPKCGSDLEDWWYSAAEAASESGFRDLAVVTPCCENATTLDELGGEHKPRFGRFVLSIMNPGDLNTPEQDAKVAAALGAPVNTVWLHL